MVREPVASARGQFSGTRVLVILEGEEGYSSIIPINTNNYIFIFDILVSMKCYDEATNKYPHTREYQSPPRENPAVALIENSIAISHLRVMRALSYREPLHVRAIFLTQKYFSRVKENISH